MEQENEDENQRAQQSDSNNQVDDEVIHHIIDQAEVGNESQTSCNPVPKIKVCIRTITISESTGMSKSQQVHRAICNLKSHG